MGRNWISLAFQSAITSSEMIASSPARPPAPDKIMGQAELSRNVDSWAELGYHLDFTHIPSTTNNYETDLLARLIKTWLTGSLAFPNKLGEKTTTNGSYILAAIILTQLPHNLRFLKTRK